MDWARKLTCLSAVPKLFVTSIQCCPLIWIRACAKQVLHSGAFAIHHLTNSVGIHIEGGAEVAQVTASESLVSGSLSKNITLHLKNGKVW